jgi:hypothetical protein
MFYECGVDILLCFAFHIGCHFVLVVFLILIDVYQNSY